MKRMKQGLLWALGFFISCSDPGFSLELAPNVTHVDELAFSVSYSCNPDPVFCHSIEAYSDVSETEEPRKEWEAQTSMPLPCPNPLKWGQDLGEGWKVLTASKPLERNRRYELILHSNKGREKRLRFCVFRDGTIVVNGYSTTEMQEERMRRCLEEGAQPPDSASEYPEKI